jgi:hypothetical protein
VDTAEVIGRQIVRQLLAEVLECDTVGCSLVAEHTEPPIARIVEPSGPEPAFALSRCEWIGAVRFAAMHVDAGPESLSVGLV